MLRRRDRSFLHLVISAFLLACIAPELAPAAPPIPTLDPNAPFTAIVQTAGAAATQTARMTTSTFTPTPQPSPSRTPTITETPTPTFLFFLPTLTFTATPVTIVPSNADYACQIISQTPQNESVIPRGNAFDAKWEVVNVGKQGWSRTDTDYFYSSGSKLHKQAIYDFEVSVPPRGNVDLVVKMLAPAQPGKYSTSWRIRIGKEVFCPLNLTIVVN